MKMTPRQCADYNLYLATIADKHKHSEKQPQMFTTVELEEEMGTEGSHFWNVRLRDPITGSSVLLSCPNKRAANALVKRLDDVNFEWTIWQNEGREVRFEDDPPRLADSQESDPGRSCCSLI